MTSLERGAFSFGEFYERRIRRIFPALVVVLAATFAIGWFLLLAEEYKQLGRHIAGGAGFISNLLLWQDSGYFDATADARPLLHLWSLGVEEQFYIAWPILLALAWKRRVSPLILTAAIAIASFCLNLWVVGGDPVGAFYSPLSRIWELLLGAALACMSLRKPAGPAKAAAISAAGRELAAAAGFALIAASLFVVNKDRSFPGWWALMPALGATLSIAAGPGAAVNRAVLAHPWLAWVGLVSYPLYLWHWPLLSFAGMSAPPEHLHQAKVAVVAASLALAWVTYRAIERPIRFGPRRRITVVALCVLMAGIGAGGWVAWREDGWSGRFNTAMSEADLDRQRARYWSKSRTRPFAPEFTNVLVYGDSQAQDMTEALGHDPRLRVALAGSNYTCSAFSLPKKGFEKTAAQCKVAFEALLESEALRTADVFIYAHGWTDDRSERDGYLDGLARIRAVNPKLRVWFFGYKPFLGNSWVSINAITRHHRGRARMNEFLNSVKVVREGENRAARTLAAELGVGWVDVAGIFCEAGCPFYEDGKFSYFDQNHWTEAGAERFFRRLARTPEYRELTARPR